MEATRMTTVIVNETNDVLKLKVGGYRHHTELATIVKQGRHDLRVNVNETYREFVLQAVGNPDEKPVIVTSDDCCDNECITIKEAGSGKLEAHRVARQQTHLGPASEGVISGAHSAGKMNGPKSTWFGWLRQLWAHKWLHS